MKFKKIIMTLSLTSIFLVGCSTSNNVEQTKQAVTQLEKENAQEYENISVASVAISHILANMGEDIVGRPTTKLELPEQYVGVEEIGSSFSPDFEKVLEVGTDLLIADSMFKDKIEKMAKEYNIETFYVDTSTYDKFMKSIDELGSKIGKEQEAESLISRLNKPLNNFNKVKENLKVAIIFGTSESNMLATEDTYVGSLAKVIGAKNIADEIVASGKSVLKEGSGGYINLNLEQILQNQPDIILRFGHGNVEEANKSFEKLFNENPAWKNLEAIKNGKVYDLDSSIFGTSANINLDIALSELGEILNGQE